MASNEFQTMAQAGDIFKQRILMTCGQIMKYGLRSTDGEIMYNNMDAKEAEAAYKSLSSEDLESIYRSNDTLLSLASGLLNEWSKIGMGPEVKQEIIWELQGENVAAKEAQRKNKHCRVIHLTFEEMKLRGWETKAQPLRWDTCGRKIGDGPTGVPAQVSLLSRGMA